VAELVDALDLGSSDESCGGSSPSARTTAPRMAGRHLKTISKPSCNWRLLDAGSA
jgi:hypothetical protein